VELSNLIASDKPKNTVLVSIFLSDFFVFVVHLSTHTSRLFHIISLVLWSHHLACVFHSIGIQYLEMFPLLLDENTWIGGCILATCGFDSL
jgi:hypothetical protein